MARQVFDQWIPEDHSGPVLAKVMQVSAVEALARPEPMSTETKRIPRSGGMAFTGAIAKGSAYTEDGATNDEITLIARKLGKVLRVADEDMKDVARIANIIQTKQLDWARSYAIGFDNACLGTTAVANGTTVPFDSLYRRLTQADAATGYVANANLTQTAGALSYTDLSDVFGKVEQGNHWADGDEVVVSHPFFRAAMRGILGTDNRPIFLENQSSVAGPVDTLWGLPVRWSLGAKTNATASDAPSGNPLMFVGNRQLMVKGDRSGPEYLLAGADSGPAFLTDEALLKVRTRRAFQVAYPAAFAAIEITAA